MHCAFDSRRYRLVDAAGEPIERTYKISEHIMRIGSCPGCPDMPVEILNLEIDPTVHSLIDNVGYAGTCAAGAPNFSESFRQTFTVKIEANTFELLHVNTIVFSSDDGTPNFP